MSDHANAHGHHHHAPAEADAGGNPVLVELVRGDMVECRYRGSVAVVDAHGKVVLAIGDIMSPIYPRSGVKPIQALPLLETGAAKAFGLGNAHIALACSSHNGSPTHVEIVRDWLARIGLGEGDLECGASLPRREEDRRALYLTGGGPSPIFDNCSGKHAGFLTVARHLGHATAGYVRFDHPVQQRLLGTLEQMTGLDLSAAPKGTDGCNIPVIGVPLGNLALAMARLGDPHDQPEHRQAACRRVRDAMAAEPYLVAGKDRFCTRVIEALGPAALVKTGAEGVFCAILPDLASGVALKIDDGNGQAAETVMIRLLQKLGVMTERGIGRLLNLLEPPVFSRTGQVVGVIRTAHDALRI